MKKFIVFTLMVLMLSSFGFADIQDDFDRADSSTLGTATNGNTWVETLGTGDWEILTKKMVGETASTTNNYAQLEVSTTNPGEFAINISWDIACSGTYSTYLFTTGASGTTYTDWGIQLNWCKSGEAQFYSGGWNTFDTSFTYAGGTEYLVEFKDCTYTGTYNCEIWIDGVLFESAANFRYNNDVSYLMPTVTSAGVVQSISCITTDGSTCGAAPPATSNINASDTLPANNSQFNTELLNLNVTVNASAVFTADLYVNGVLNQTGTHTAGTDKDINFNLTFLNTTEETFTYYMYLNTSTNNVTTSTKTFHIDNVFPQITWTTPNNANTSIIGDTLYSSIFIEDPNMFSYYYNITHPNGTQYYFDKNITMAGLTNHTINDTVSFSGQEGYFNAYVEVCDGHTDQNITIDSIEIENVTLVVEDEGDHINVSMLEGGNTESVSYIEEDDKVSFGFVSDSTTSSEQFIVESNHYIHILDGLTEYEGHLVMGKKWVDFETDDLQSVHIVRLSDYSVEVTVTKFTGTDEWDFESIGELNCRNQTRTFLVHVSNTSNNSQVLSGDVSEYLLNVTLNSSYYTSANATLYWNGTAYPGTATNTSGHFYFNTSITIPPAPEDVNITYYWNYFLGSHEFNTTNQNTSVFAPKIGNCSYYPTQWVEYQIKDETFETLLNGSITFQFKYYNNAYSNNFNGLMTDNTTFPICMYPSWGNFSTNATIQYQTSESGYTAREYQTLGFEVYESNRTVDLFLLAGAAEITFHIIDDGDNNLQGVTIEAYRYRIASDTDVLVETESTDAEGKVILDLASGTTFYSFKIYDANGTLKISTARFKLFSSTYEYIIQTGRANPLASRLRLFANLEDSLTYDTVTRLISYTYNYSGGSPDQWCFTITGNGTQWNYQCLNTSTGSFNYTITQLNVTYLATVQAVTADQPTVVKQLGIDTNTPLKDIFGGTNTLFIALIIFLVVSLLGLVNANIAIVLSLISVIIMSLFKLIPLSWEWLVGVIILGLAMLWVVNRR